MHRRNNRQSRQTLQNEHSEDFRIAIDITFRDFCSDPSLSEYEFAANLSNVERKYIHEKCRRLGLKSKSKGKEPERILTMYKTVTVEHNALTLKTSEESLNTIQSYVASHSVDLNPHFENIRDGGDSVVGRLRFETLPPVPPQPNSHAYAEFRRNLPVWESRSKIIELIERNAVTIISGETGSGKTTQVPQFILENCTATAQKCRIICTQPRRLSTLAVTERVASERGEHVGETCGYQMKLKSLLGLNSALIYCTTGVLLRTLMTGFEVLNNITHIVIDEIHERDKFTDFVLITLRESLKQFPSLRLILMSATLDIELFEKYFTNVAKINISGRTYPIEHYFLDRILVELNYESEQMKMVREKNRKNEVPEKCQQTEVVSDEMDAVLLAYSEDPSEDNFVQILHLILSNEVGVDYRESNGLRTALMIVAAEGVMEHLEQLLSLGADVTLKCKRGLTAVEYARAYHRLEAAAYVEHCARSQTASSSADCSDSTLDLYNRTTLEDVIDYELIVAIVTHVHATSRANNMGVLVFLPGYDDIVGLFEALAAAPVAAALKICMLHGSMTVDSQNDVFRRSAQRKVVLSTNVAETSITIDDIAYVVDTGRVKQKSYDSLSGTSTLETTWISMASCKQRAGRAGRVAPGKCFHLFSRTRYESLLVNTIPEILTVPLHELCLQTKRLAPQGTRIAEFLSRALEAPSLASIRSAIADLISLGALDSGEELTVLGTQLLKLSVAPHLGKMLLYSIVFKCLDPVLTVVATLAHKEPFVLPSRGVEKSGANSKRRSLCLASLSDHMALITVYQKWCKSKMGNYEWKFCAENFISSSCMETIELTRKQLLTQMRTTKMIPVNHMIGELTVNNEDWSLVKAALCAGFYPNVAFSINNKLIGRHEKRVLTHATSCVRDPKHFSSGLWFVFEEMSKLGKLCNLKGITAVTPLTVVLIGGSTIYFDTASNVLQIDDSVSVTVPSSDIWKFRLAMDSFIRTHVAHPERYLYDFQDSFILETVRKVLENEENLFGLVRPELTFGPKEFVPNRFQRNQKNGIAGASGNGYRNGPNPTNSNWNGASTSRQQYPNHHPQRNPNFSSSTVSRQYPNAEQGNGFRQSQETVANGPSTSSFNGNDQAGVPAQTYNLSNENRQYGVNRNQLINMIAPRDVAVSLTAKFYIIRPVQLQNVSISLSQWRWVFSPQTESKVIKALNNNFEVYLLYNIRRSMEFQGVAKVTGVLNDAGPSRAMSIEWICVYTLHYDEVLDWIRPRPHHIEDGFELPIGVGPRIMELMIQRTRSEQDCRTKHCRQILENPQDPQHMNPKRRKGGRRYKRNWNRAPT